MAIGDHALAPTSGVHYDIVNITRDPQDPFLTGTRSSEPCPKTPEETSESPKMVNHEEVGGDNSRRSSLNRKRSMDSTPSSSPESKRDAIEVFEKMANQIDRLIEVIALRQFEAKEGTSSTPAYTIIDCIQCLDAMNQVDVGTELYFYALDLFRQEDYRMIFMGLERPGMRLKWLKHMYVQEQH